MLGRVVGERRGEGEEWMRQEDGEALPELVSDKRERGACRGQGDWAAGRWRGGQGGSCLDGRAQPVRREGGGVHWCGFEMKRGEWGRGVVRVVCAPGMWGQRVRVRGLFV